MYIYIYTKYMYIYIIYLHVYIIYMCIIYSIYTHIYYTYICIYIHIYCDFVSNILFIKESILIIGDIRMEKISKVLLATW